MTKKVNIVKLFSRVLVLGNSRRIDKRQSIQLCSPHTGLESQVRFTFITQIDSIKIVFHEISVALRYTKQFHIASRDSGEVFADLALLKSVAACLPLTNQDFT